MEFRVATVPILWGYLETQMTIDILHDTDNLKVCIQLYLCLKREGEKNWYNTRNIVLMLLQYILPDGKILNT